MEFPCIVLTPAKVASFLWETLPLSPTLSHLSDEALRISPLTRCDLMTQNYAEEKLVDLNFCFITLFTKRAIVQVCKINLIFIRIVRREQSLPFGVPLSRVKKIIERTHLLACLLHFILTNRTRFIIFICSEKRV